jgi:hypothetical protein
MNMELRGIPGLGRVVALPALCLATAALGGGLAVGQVLRVPRLGVAAVAVGIFGLYQLVRALWLLSRLRRTADDWLRSATGRFVPPAYTWRAAQLCSPRERRVLARTLRLIARRAFDRKIGPPQYLRAVREHRESVQLLARTLERVQEPVTAAGMLHARELISNGASPLWGTTKDEALGDAIATTLAILTSGARSPIATARAA